ncbi:DNA-directed RNA polymerase I subunit rpa49 [Agyrium rufum]|nr:DNA-directed RNA polymerase I subunit rpa49 [Agyrium rufum]
MKRRRDSDQGDRVISEESRGPMVENVKFNIRSNLGEWVPALVKSPGLSLPSDLSFNAYSVLRTRSATDTSQRTIILSEHELLLHTSRHPQIAYTGREEEVVGTGKDLNHYVGVYDAATGQLELVPARVLAVRHELKLEIGLVTLEEAEQTKRETAVQMRLAARNQLGETFGTKKSQLAIFNLVQNSIRPSATNENKDAHLNANAISNAVLESMSQFSSIPIASRADLQAEIDGAKPRPKPNLETNVLTEVYTVESMFAGTFLLERMNVKPWEDKVLAGEGIETRSQYVAHRLQNIVRSAGLRKIKTLRLLLVLLDWYGHIIAANDGRSVKKLGKREETHEAIGKDISISVIDHFNDRFAPDGVLRKWNIDLVITHICAMALIVDDFVVDMCDIRADLKLSKREIKQYFTELGCVIKVPTPGEQEKLGISKTDMIDHWMARLKLPLQFPVSRLGMKNSSRR